MIASDVRERTAALDAAVDSDWWTGYFERYAEAARLAVGASDAGPKPLSPQHTGAAARWGRGPEARGDLLTRSPCSTTLGTKINRGDNVADNLLPAADIAAYERAIDIYDALLAVLNARLDQGADDRELVGLLREDAVRYAAEQRDLRATDRAAVHRVVSEYPAVVRELRDALPG